MKVVVCDDDAAVRAVVTRLAEAAGHTVIAETDSGDDAVELVSRFGADAMVLDLSLPLGSGTSVVWELRERGVPCQIVVFSAYAEGHPDVPAAAVRAIVDKPDFDALERVLNELAVGRVAADEAAEERRKPSRDRPAVPSHGARTASGLEEPATFASVVEILEPGDVVLRVHVEPPSPLVTPWDELAQVDRLLAVARDLRMVLRVQDRLSTEDGDVVVLLLSGGRIGVESVWRRLVRLHAVAGVGGVLTAGWAVQDEDEPSYVTVARARDAAARSVGQPAGDRLWAG